MTQPSMNDWQEAVSAEGKKFYYHKATRISVWEIPEDFNPPSNNSIVENSDWKEYKTEKGKKYYYNTVTGIRQWDPPLEISQPKSTPLSPNSGNSSSISISSGSSSSSSNNNNNNSISPSSTTPTAISSSSSTIINNNSNNSNSNSSNNDSNNNNKEDPIQIFKNLLTDNSISSACTFEKALKLIASDERYQSLKTMSERKQAFLDYQIDRKKFEQEEKRKKDKKIKDEFIQLLRDSKEVTTLMSWRRASLYFEGEPRWEAIEVERERETLFHEYILELEKKEKEQLLASKKDQMKLLRQKLESDPSINVYSQWRKVKDTYEKDEIFQILDQFDFLTVFENYIRDLEKRLDDQKRLEKEKLKRECRKNRDQFREFLNDKYLNQEIHALTKWKQFKDKYENEPVFINLSQRTIGSTPLELFSDFREDLEVKYENDYKMLKEIYKDIQFKYTPETTLESLKSQFSTHQNYKQISESNLLPYLEYLKYKEETKEKSLAKKRISHFKQLLTDTKTITKSSNWEEVKPSIENKKEYIELENEQDRLNIFNSYIDYLSKKAQEEDEGNEEGELILSPKKSNHDNGSSNGNGSIKKRRSYGGETDEDRYYDRDRDSRDTHRDRDRDRERDRDRSRSYKKEKR